jgi:hypothetical protein
MEPRPKPQTRQKIKVSPALRCPQNQPDTPKNKFAGKLEKKAKKEQN